MNCFRKFTRSRRGNMAMSAALSLGALLVAAGFSLDYLGASQARSALQNAADAAALSSLADQDATDAEIKAAAQNTLLANIATAGLETPPSISTTVEHDYVGRTTTARVTATAAVPTTLMKLARIEAVDIAVSAKAFLKRKALPACVFALDPSSEGAFTVEGSGAVSVPNCEIQINSSNSRALIRRGAGDLTAKAIRVVGRYAPGHYNTTPLTSQPAVEDPLGPVPEPTITGACTYNNKSFGTAVSLPAGSIYCGSIHFGANARFEPGIHYFRGATVTAAANAVITGEKVMLFFDKDSSISNASGTGEFRLSAPDSGLYKGIALFGSREVSSTVKTFAFHGNKAFKVDGAIYLPRQHWYMTGSTELTVSSEFGWMIAYRFTYTGNSNMSLGTGIPPGGIGEGYIALVE